jgi:hypothetical protein
MVPRVKAETFNPDRPSKRYSIDYLPVTMRESGRRRAAYEMSDNSKHSDAPCQGVAAIWRWF